LSDLNPSFMSWYEHLSPFGAQFAAPIFCLRNVRLTQVRRLKGGHYRLTLADSLQASRTAMWFSPPKDQTLLVDDVANVSVVDALVEPQWNYFGGKRTLQLLIQDIRAAGLVPRVGPC